MTFSPSIFFGKYFRIAFLAVFVVEIVSFLGFLYPPVNVLTCVLIIGLTFYLVQRRLLYGVMIVMAELAVASKGYLFSLPFDQFDLSLRLGIFIAVMTAWFFHLIRTRSSHFFSTKLFIPYCAVVAFIIFSVAVAYWRGNALANIFFDVNGYLFLGLALPFIDAIRSKKDIADVLQVLLGAVTISIIKTLFLLFIFSQQFVAVLPDIYTWVRRTGVGEITQLGNFTRVFFQSHIYELFIFLGAFIFLLFAPGFRKTDVRSWWSLFFRGALALLVVFVSYSRSFWLGTLLVMFSIYLLGFFVWKFHWQKMAAITGILLVVAVLDFIFVFGLVNFPLPTRDISVSARGLITDRTENVTTEAAGASRNALLRPLLTKVLEHPILGSGFGTTVTYPTHDPRALENNPDGLYTTFSFEWGYLDLWLKLGIFGLITYLYFLGQLFFSTWPFFRTPTQEGNSLIIGIMLGFLSVLLIHTTTPFLNHPLGIGWVVFSWAAIEVYNNRKK